MLCAVLTGGHLKDVSYAQEGLQCVPVGHHLWMKTEKKFSHAVGDGNLPNLS